MPVGGILKTSLIIQCNGLLMVLRGPGKLLGAEPIQYPFLTLRLAGVALDVGRAVLVNSLALFGITMIGVLIAGS